MDYNEMTYKSKSKLKNFSHNTRYKVAVDLCKDKRNVLDYGTGSGYFLRLLSLKNTDISLTGFEPIKEMYEKAKKENSDLENLKIIDKIDFSQKFDCVTCLEVMEHLTADSQKKIIRDCKRLLANDGRIIISVPIETGISGFCKNLFRFLIRQSHAETFSQVVRSLFGLKIKRKVVDGYIYSHVGFRYKDLEAILRSEGLNIRKKLFSPLKLIGPVLNSQVFYILDLVSHSKDERR